MRKAGQPPVRKLLQEMTPAELRDWLGNHQAELEDFCSYAQRYIKGRARRGQRTHTDERYEQFFERAADLLAGLDEMRQVAAEAAAQKDTDA
jgi:hypothetical protein